MVTTKLIATIGPATASRERLKEMFDVGLDVCRLNFSHGALDEHERTLANIRELAAERDQPICVIGDLSGPKMRLRPFPGGPVELTTGQTVAMVGAADHSTAERLAVTLPESLSEIAIGHRVYIDDGLVRLLVTDITDEGVICTCTAGGTISSGKGVNLPDTRVPGPSLTEKDRRDLAWAIAHGVDYVAQSFVREPEDLYELKRLIKPSDSNLRVIVKIEKTEALDHLDELIANSDAILVARGDLGIETDLWRVPLAQKEIVTRCQAAGVPVIVATQMLQSMVNAPMPTRAEVSDVANAILERVDAVMLSAETAVGKYPVQAVDMMNRIAAATEEYLANRPPSETWGTVTARFRPTAAVAHAAVHAARDLGARVVAVWSATGKTVRLVAKHRLPMPVVGLTHNEWVYRQINLLFGVIPIRVAPMDSPAQMAATLDAELLRRKLALAGDLVVVVSSTRPHVPGATDTTMVHRVGSEPAG